MAASDSCSSTAAGSGTRASGRGWGGSASAASSTSSIASCEGRRTPASCQGAPPRLPASATSSPSTPTRACPEARLIGCRARPLVFGGRGGAPAPLGARRLAAASVDSWNANPRDGALEDAGQPASHGLGAGRLSDAGGRVDGAGHVARGHEDFFAASPEKYAPQYDGYCAWAMTERHFQAQP